MRGVTLVELLVVLMVLGVVTVVSSLALASLRPPVESERVRTLLQARASAIRTGRAAIVPVGGGNLVRFLPDGRALGLGVDQLSGALISAYR